LSAEPAHFSIESVSLVAAASKRLAGLRVERLRTRPNAQPSKAICFCEELMRICVLRERRRAEKERDYYTDVADHAKTVARHDSLPGFAGAPLIFYNRALLDSRYKVVIGRQTAEVDFSRPRDIEITL
jgi:hypothetical protein